MGEILPVQDIPMVTKYFLQGVYTMKQKILSIICCTLMLLSMMLLTGCGGGHGGSGSASGSISGSGE